MQEQNNVYQIPKGAHQEDYLDNPSNRVENSIDNEAGVILDLHRASERAVSLEQVKALQEVDAIITRSEQERAPIIDQNTPNYLNNQEKKHYLNIKSVGLDLAKIRHETLYDMFVVDDEQSAKLKRK